MRISIPAWVLFLAIVVARCGAVASGQPVTGAEKATQELIRGGMPILFVGRVTDVDSSDCAKTGSKNVRYSVEQVLFGFAPPKVVNVPYQICKQPSELFSPGTELLVLAVYYPRGFIGGRKELVWPRTPANIKRAQLLLNNDLKKKIAQFIRHHGSHNNPVVVFEGLLREAVPKLPEPTVCTVIPLIPTKYDVQDVMQGDLTAKQVTVNFGLCGNLPEAPFRVG